MTERGWKNDTLVSILRNLKYDLQQNIIIEAPPPFLKYLALRRIGISVWYAKLKSSDLRTVESDFFINNLMTYVNKIYEDVCKIEIVEAYKEMMVPVIKSIGKEITYFFNQVKFSNKTVGELEIYWDKICWTQQGTINTLKTAARILNSTNFAADFISQYKLECHQSLVEKIRYLHKIYPNEFVMSESMDKIIVKSNQLAFLVLYSQNEIERLSKVIKMEEEADSCEDILKWCIYNHKEAAVQYLWKNIANVEVKKRILEFVAFGDKKWRRINPNALLFFSIQMSQVQLQKVNAIKKHLFLVEKIHTISMWCDIISVKRYVLALFKAKGFYESFQIISHCWLAELLYLKDYDDVFKEFCFRFNIDSEERILKLYYDYYYTDFKAKRHKVVLASLIKIASAENKKKLKFCGTTYLCCTNLILEEKMNVFDKFINQILEENEIFEFCKIFFENWSIELFTNAINNDKFDLVEKIVIKFCEKENINDFKRKLPYVNNARIINNIFEGFEDVGDDLLLIRVDKFLRYCFKENEKEIIKCKSLIFNIDSDSHGCLKKFFTILTELLEIKLWPIVERYWKWIFFATEDKMDSTDKIFCRICKIINATEERKSEPFKGTMEYYTLLKIFIKSCFTQEEEEEKLMEEFMKWDDFISLIKTSLHQSKYNYIDDFLYLCCTSDTKVDEFKFKFMKKFGCMMLFKLIKQDNIEEAKTLMEWFNPPVEAANSFKEYFFDFIKVKKDSYAKNKPSNKAARKRRNAFWISVKERGNRCLELLISRAEQKRDTNLRHGYHSG